MGKSSKEKKRKSSTKQELEEEEKPIIPDVKKPKKLKKTETLEVKIKAITEKPETKTPPIIGYFPSGYDPLKKSGSGGVKVYAPLKPRNPDNPRMQVVVSPKGSDVNFVGTSYTGEATRPHLCNYALGVFDKKNGVLKMVPIAANKIFRLEPKIATLDEVEENRDDEPDAADKFKTLALAYSTKKDIRRDVKRETLRQTEDPAMQEDMEKKLRGIKINAEALKALTSTANSRNIPPYDLQAPSVDKAYPLDRIILNGEWDYLLDIFELTQSGSNLSPDVYPTFVRNRVHNLENIKDESEKKRIAGILSYITHLIKYRDKCSMDGVQSAKRHKLPSILLQKFASMFGTASERSIPADKINLLINYVLVLTLFVDDFRSDPSDIAKDLRIQSYTLRENYKYIGCKFKSENKVTLATLEVPLKFETIRRKNKGNKK